MLTNATARTGESWPVTGLSIRSRNLSANGLKDRLSKLAAATTLHVPNPVAALKTNVSCVSFCDRRVMNDCLQC